MAEGNGRAWTHQWAVRGPGMPQKILRSDKELDEKKVKEIYLKTVKFLESKANRHDHDVPWKIEPMSEADLVKAGLQWCLKETKRRNHRALIEFYGGKIIGGKIGDDGKFIPDEKPEKPVKKEKVKVDVKLPSK